MAQVATAQEAVCPLYLLYVSQFPSFYRFENRNDEVFIFVHPQEIA
jgi:hypothetical protein